MNQEFVAVDVLPTKRHREVDGVIYLTVTLRKSTTGEKWIARTEKKGNRVEEPYGKLVIRSKDFKPSVAGTYEIAILKGLLFTDDDRSTQKICDKAIEMKLVKLNADIACLIREQFSDQEIEEMGLWWIVIMHEPIEPIKAVNHSNLLAVSRDDGGRWLRTYKDSPARRWRRDGGFAFLVSRVS